jgi:hypothetical protein
VDDGHRHALVPDDEVGERALRLGAPVVLGRDGDGAEESHSVRVAVVPDVGSSTGIANDLARPTDRAHRKGFHEILATRRLDRRPRRWETAFRRWSLRHT